LSFVTKLGCSVTELLQFHWENLAAGLQETSILWQIKVICCWLSDCL